MSIDPAPARQLLRNVIANIVSIGATAGVAIILVPVLIKSMGVERYGVWATLSAMLGLLSILDVGTTTAVNRFAARYRAQGQPQKLNAVFTAAVGFFGLLGVALSLGAFALAQGVDYLFSPSVTSDSLTNASTAVLWIAGGLALRLAHGPFIGVLAGAQRDDRRNYANLIAVTIRLVLTLLLLRYWRVDVSAPAVAFGLATGVSLALHALMAKRTVPSLRLVSPRAATMAVREVIGLSGPVSIISIATLTLFHGPSLLLARLDGTSEVAKYSVAMLLIGTATQLISAYPAVLLAWFSMLHGLDRQEEAVARALAACRAIGIAACAIVGTVGLGGRGILNYWVGPEIATAHITLTILLVGFAGTWPNSVLQTALAARADLSRYACYWIAAATVSMGSVSLLAAFGMGAVGAAMGVTVPLALMHWLWVPKHAGGVLGFDRFTYLRATFGGPAIAAGLAVVGSYLAVFMVGRVLPVARPIRSLMLATIFILMYMALTWFFVIGPQDRGMLLRVLRVLRQRLAARR